MNKVKSLAKVQTNEHGGKIIVQSHNALQSSLFWELNPRHINRLNELICSVTMVMSVEIGFEFS